MVKIVISLKTLYAIVGVFISVLLIGMGVYAYGTSSPSVVGHTLSEFQSSCTGLITFSINGWSCTNVPVTCTGAAQALTWNGANWVCATILI